MEYHINNNLWSTILMFYIHFYLALAVAMICTFFITQGLFAIAIQIRKIEQTRKDQAQWLKNKLDEGRNQDNY